MYVYCNVTLGSRKTGWNMGMDRGRGGSASVSVSKTVRAYGIEHYVVERFEIKLNL